jgi:hypothetical protein
MFRRALEDIWWAGVRSASEKKRKGRKDLV